MSSKWKAEAGSRTSAFCFRAGRWWVTSGARPPLPAPCHLGHRTFRCSPCPPSAITGGIATGKSTFTRTLGALTGAGFFDTDACARQLLESDAASLAAVRETFGTGVFDPSGLAVDRAALRSVVFSDPSRRSALEAILHPRVRARWQAWLEERLQKSPDAILLVEIPLLYETGAADFFG